MSNSLESAFKNITDWVRGIPLNWQTLDHRRSPAGDWPSAPARRHSAGNRPPTSCHPTRPSRSRPPWMGILAIKTGYFREHSFTGYFREHSFIGYFREHSFIGYFREHSCIGYFREHSFIGYFREHSFMLEEGTRRNCGGGAHKIDTQWGDLVKSIPDLPWKDKIV